MEPIDLSVNIRISYCVQRAICLNLISVTTLQYKLSITSENEYAMECVKNAKYIRFCENIEQMAYGPLSEGDSSHMKLNK
jgi:hypothetical protein